MDRLLELTSRAEAEHFWFRGFRRFVAPALRRAASGRTNLTLLDCGCGTGYNLSLLAPYGRVHGMDLTAAGLEIAARRTARNTARGTTGNGTPLVAPPLVRADATRIPYRSESFDVVTSFDMLQCVPDDRAAVREMARVLKPGGYLVATVAALEMLHGDHSVLSEEVRRYTRAGMRRVLADARLEEVRVTYAFGSTCPLVLGVRVAQRLWRGHAQAGDLEITVPPAPVNAALTALVMGEAAIAPYLPMPFGSSLVVLARKRQG